MTKAEITENPDGTHSLFIDDQEVFTGDLEECETLALEAFDNRHESTTGGE